MNIKSIFCVLVLGFVASPGAWGKDLWAKSYLGKKAPAFVVEKWLTAAPPTEGKFVLIDFWATWCPPCRKAIPTLNAIYRQFKDQLCVIGVSAESEEAVRAFKSPLIEYAVAIDPKKRMSLELEIRGIPHVLLIDPQGIVRWQGYPLLEGDELTVPVVKKLINKYSLR